MAEKKYVAPDEMKIAAQEAWFNNPIKLGAVSALIAGVGARPKTFEIDCLVENTRAVEIKWRDATTDGDHITKEHTRLQAIANAGYHPVRVMFYYPNRSQAMRIQKTLETLYHGLNGEYFFGDAAWEYVCTQTGADLKGILERIAEGNRGNA